MNKLYKNLISEITDTLDPLHCAISDLKKADPDNIIDLAVLCTRAKIYNFGMQMCKLLRQKRYDEIENITARLIRLISIHRNQLYKLTKIRTIDLSNFRFLCELKKLIKCVRMTFTPEKF
jgi:hypothetical protein